MQVHVDGDIIVYRAGYSAEHNFYHLHYMEDGTEVIKSFDGAKDYKAFIVGKDFGASGYWVENETRVEPEESALYNTRSILRTIADDLQVEMDDLRLYLSGKENYRLGIATIKPYKGNRDPTKKPVHAPAIKELLRNRYGAKTSDGQEADDDIAIAHMAAFEDDPLGTIICTIDKDLDTVPGFHYNFVTKTNYYVSHREAIVNFWKQMVTGDTVDNIPGIPGAGKVAAQKLLGDLVPDDSGIQTDALPLVCYARVRPLYERAYAEKADEALLEMGRLLYIRHKEDVWWQAPTKVL